MKVILYANVSANGQVLLSEKPNHQLPQEILSLSIQDIKRTGNLVMGRKSFENFEKAFGGMNNVRQVLPGVEFVSLSGTANTNHNYKIVNTPEEALKYLAERGFSEIYIGGGTETYNAFLEKNLITEMLLNVIPIVITGGILGKQDLLNIKFKLSGHKLLSDDVIQLHYSRI